MNNLGFGIQGLSEQILDGILQTNSMTATLADRVFFDDARTTYLSLGIGATFVNRTVDYSSLIFGDQSRFKKYSMIGKRHINCLTNESNKYNNTF